MTLLQERAGSSSAKEFEATPRALHPRFYDLIDRSPLERKARMLASGAVLDIKHEGEHATGSFKERGSVNALLHLQSDEKAVVASAGSFAVAAARTAHQLDKDVHIIVPESIAPNKKAKLHSYNASYEIHGVTFDDADAYARSIGDRVYISPFDNMDVITGHSTPASELLEQYGDMPLTIFVGLGGAGLAAATLLATQGHDVRVVGVQLEGNDSTERSLIQEYGVSEASNPNTLCEGSAVRLVGELPLEIIRANRERFDIVTVKPALVGAMLDDELNKREPLIPIYGETTAMEGFPETTAVLAEAGALVYARTHNFDGSQYVAVRTGSNFDPERVMQALDYHKNVRKALGTRSTGLTIAHGWHGQK